MTKKSQLKANSRDREIEATLVIWSETQQIVAGEIADLDSIGNYRLLPQDSEAIHDLYLDTPDHALEEQKLALRVRETGATRLIALKGPSQPTDWGGVERLEIEARWSPDALNRVLKELMDRGVKMLQQRQDFDDGHPLDVMMCLGLEVIQDRKDHREVRNIVHAGEESGLVLAEMAIDSVVYHFSSQEVRHYEVEVEAKAGNGPTVLKTVIESLIAMYGPALRRWDHAKLATGKVVEEMLNKGILKGLIDINNNLKPVAYDRIDDYLKRSNI